ncbi:M23 family metallopeptidase [Parvularcula sp. LCG005]|uniref:M23 family metallopeptidase n=1 Tax=Parvularcula sp. LCG005 TaxID=3078805 RepID=UPI0029433A2C|nr:M23 family metallopeptidase [Parvularcula sp. LCG005]WOI54445.1 M23 family metallopeptidase [Parvularcula sp. LCG005]
MTTRHPNRTPGSGLLPVALLSVAIGGAGLLSIGATVLKSAFFPAEDVPAVMASPVVAEKISPTAAARTAASRIVISTAREAEIAGAQPPEAVEMAMAVPMPRLKPRKPRPRPDGIPVVHAIDPSAQYMAPRGPVAFAMAEDFTGGRESLFAEYAQARLRDRTERAYSTLVLARGENLAQMLEAVGAQPDHIASLLSTADEVSPIAKLPAGAAIDYAFDTIFAESPDGQQTYERRLTRLRFRPDDRHIVTAWRQPDGSYDARNEEVDVERRYAAVGGVIRHSLFAAAQRSEIPPEVMSKFANLFLYDIDFARDIHGGDRFETVYEVFYDEQGQYVGSGDIVFAALTWSGKRHAKGYYRFTGAEGMDTPYFDFNGESASRLLMKTPIEGARVTSGFGKRQHPILGYTKDHNGVDFGAPSGTPIMAAGDGKIVRADVFGTYGNYVRIQHAHGYSTAYAHLKGFAKGLKAGSKVRQGDIIGYVGTTGRSTGPHLHYEVYKADARQNPMTLEVANGRVLEGQTLHEFAQYRDYVDTIRVYPQTVLVATNE